MTDRAYIAPDLRRLLEEKGFLKRPTHPNPPAPKIEEMIAKARKRGLAISLRDEPATDDEEEPTCFGTVTAPDLDSWEAEDRHCAAAVAKALGKALGATEPRQREIDFDRAAD